MGGLLQTLEVPKQRSTLPDLIGREARRRRRRRLLRWGALVALAIAAGAAAALLRPRPVPLAARFRTAVVSKGGVVREVHATGHVEAVTTVQVGAEISGRLATVEVDFNDRVRAGQVMARFDRELLGLQAAQARATLQSARAALAQAEVDAEHVQSARVRQELLFAQRSTTEADYESATSAARLAAQRVLAARAQVAAQSASWELARRTLARAVIRAPIDGIVVTRNVDPGQTVASAFQTPVLFTVAADLERMRVLAAVDEADIGEVALRQPASFTVNAWPERAFTGSVTEVRNSPALVQDVVTYQVVIEVHNADLALKPGMTASVRIRTASVADALRVPSAALRFTPPGEAEPAAPGLWVLRDGGLRRLEARAGISDGEITALASGPPAGTIVLFELSPEGRSAYGLAH